ncbi:hypothetical protein ACFSAG_00315 [Sphingorhabdus buctiana]|uniref:Uncharacterized protein n=2 Tax=Bacteria TaxID=2 RepID=A0ABW4M958_9SPHN
MRDEVANLSNGGKSVAVVAQTQKDPVEICDSAVAMDVALDALAEFSRLHAIKTNDIFFWIDEKDLENVIYHSSEPN